ncbi:hypothetical protein L1077_04770 [Pseudoalteromonas luteoviolacea]|uniref:hypothetical protein n=1 Tax=Pseudoalteromonas luteoviolacea TaxID=43657 RepID=UPI001F34DE4B|nr:hypothetical protein [Pseudoalteromonas luteoviolacea]MCF6438742.1 hypothetical protein [Pseudoalteromonas luteoviolacea]
MKKLIALLLATGFQSVAYASVEANIDYLEMKTSSHIKKLLIAENIGRGNVELTIEPMRLGASDGKGIEITDSAGRSIFFSIDDGHSAIIWDNAVVASTNSFPVYVGGKYRFFLNITDSAIKVNRVTENGMVSMFEYNKVLTPPLDYKLVTQRSGARFHNVLITTY